MAREWTPDEDALIEGRTNKQVSELLPHRSVAAIQKRREILGVGQPVAGITVQHMPPRTQNWPETHESPEHEEFIALPDELDIGDDPTPEQLDALIDAMIQMDSAVTGLAPTRDTVTVAPKDSHLPFGIVFTGDWHVGAGGVELDRLRRDVARIGETDGLFGVAMGDLVEGVGASNKASPALYTGVMNKSNVQVSLAVHIANLARGKWVCVIDGNHDQFAYRATGIDRGAAIARGIGAPRFGQGGATVFVVLDGVQYVVGVRHNGKGNSQINTTNAQRRTFDEWPEWRNCDVICLAHLHYNDLAVTPRKGGQCVYLRSGTAKTHDLYAKDNGYTPEYGMPIAVFYPGEKRVIPFRGDQFDVALRFLEMERDRYRQAKAA